MILKSDKIKAFLTEKKNITIIYIIVIIGVIALCLPSFRDKEEVAEEKITAEQTEERVEKILAEISGVGKCSVMITYKSSGEYITAKDVTESGDESRSNKDEKNVIVGSGSGERPFVIKEKMPEVLGVVVVCKGGENAKVKKDVSDAVCALCGITANKVKVFEK